MQKFNGFPTKEAQMAYLYQWQKDNPDKVKNYKDNWKLKNPEKRKKARNTWSGNNKEYMRNWAREDTRKKRLKVVNNLSAICQCCKEVTYEFLAIDHINGDGKADHKRCKNTAKIVIRDGFPVNKYQILCYNCNTAKGHNKICPHNHFNVFDRSTWTVLV